MGSTNNPVFQIPQNFGTQHTQLSGCQHHERVENIRTLESKEMVLNSSLGFFNGQGFWMMRMMMMMTVHKTVMYNAHIETKGR